MVDENVCEYALGIFLKCFDSQLAKSHTFIILLCQSILLCLMPGDFILSKG